MPLRSRRVYLLLALALGPAALAAPPGAATLGDAQRDPAGYTWSVRAQLDQEPNGRVTALASTDAGLIAAHAPANAISRVDAQGQVSVEASLSYPATSFSAGADGVFAALGAAGVADAADVLQRDAAGAWTLAYDGAEEQAVVGQTRGFVYAFAGQAGQDGAVHAQTRRGWQASVAALPGALPTVAAAHGRAVFVGAGPSDPAGGPALLFSGRRTRFSQVALADPNPAPAAGERQQVTALLSAPGFLVVALGTYDAASGLPLRGQVLLVGDGKRGATVQALNLPMEAPLSLAWIDGSLSVGTSGGRLLHQEAGQWADEVGLPQNDGVTALHVDRVSGALLAGVQTPGGAQILARAVKQVPPPSSPATLAATAAVGKVDLAWQDMSNDETGFQVQRSPAGQNAFAQIAMTPADTTAYSDTSVQADTSYDYRVLAVNSGGASAPSNVATVKTPPAPPATVPTSPSNLNANADVGKVTLTWLDTSNDETGFRVERSAAGQNAFAQVAMTPAGATTYSDTAVQPNTSYDYRVLAVNSGGASTPSNVATVKTPAAGPNYVTDVKPILLGNNAFNLSCAGCHAAGRPFRFTGQDDTADYTATLGYVNTADAANSDLLLRATKIKGHPLAVIDPASPQYKTILDWIAGGAPFN